MPRQGSTKTSNRALWALSVCVAAPALIQIALVVYAIACRIGYPFDLEWMEGGMLQHAFRVGGEGIYVAPSVDFVPFPYPPLYAYGVALVGKVVGVSYQSARALSVMGLCALALLFVAQTLKQREEDQAVDTWCQVVFALLGLAGLASVYPFVEGWYDIARVDMVFMALVVSGLSLIASAGADAAKISTNPRKIVLAALILVLAFFAKQTGAAFVFAAFLWLLASNRRQAFLFAVVAGTAAALGIALLVATTEGWFWTYCFEVMRGHPFSWDRFWQSFAFIAEHYWSFVATIFVVGVFLLKALCFSNSRPRLDAKGRRLLAMMWFAVVSVFVGGAGWGKSWAHFNAYIPAFVCVALAASMGLSWLSARGRHPLVAWFLASVVAAHMLLAHWSPNKFIPTKEDAAAGNRLVQEMAEVEGEIFVPFHPWYAHLAGKKMFLHRMPVLDISHSGRWKIEGLGASFKSKRFERVYWDNRGIDAPFAALRRHYRRSAPIEASKKPQVYTGAGSPAEVGPHEKRLLTPTERWLPMP